MFAAQMLAAILLMYHRWVVATTAGLHGDCGWHAVRYTQSSFNPPISGILPFRWIDGPNVHATRMGDGLPLPGRPVEMASRNSSLLERVCFVVSAVGVYSYFDLLDFLPFPAALVVAILVVPVLAEVIVRIAARLGLFP